MSHRQRPLIWDPQEIRSGKGRSHGPSVTERRPRGPVGVWCGRPTPPYGANEARRRVTQTENQRGTSGEGEPLKSGPGEVARYHPPGGSSGGRAENGLASLHREGQHGEVEPRAASVISG